MNERTGERARGPATSKQIHAAAFVQLI